jgi:hypothetical protein
MLSGSEKGRKLLAMAIEDSLQVIQRYRLAFLETQAEESQIVLIRSFIKMLSYCSAGISADSEGNSLQANAKTLYVEVFEAKFT